MKTIDFVTAIYVLMTIAASVSLATEEFVNYETIEPVRHHIVKRKGGKGGGRRGGSSSGRSNPRNSYPKQPPPQPQPNYNQYPKQPAYNPNYNPNTGHQSGHGYPQTGVNQNYGQKSGGLGGIFGGGTGIGQKSNTGSLLKGGAVGGVLGAAAGAYGGYKLGKMVGGLGRGGHYGYYDSDSRRYQPCRPPPEIRFDPVMNTSYIPVDSGYDQRCSYHERDPSDYYRNQYHQNYRYGINAQNKCIVDNATIIIAFILNAFIVRVTIFGPKYYLT